VFSSLLSPRVCAGFTDTPGSMVRADAYVGEIESGNVSLYRLVCSALLL
jgi:hypothetical protein